MRVAFVVHGALAQPTGGYIYDRLIVERLRARGIEVDVVSITPGSDPDALVRRLEAARLTVVVGDALAVHEIAPAFERGAGGAARVLLVHHLASWEIEAVAGSALYADEARAIAASDCLVATSATTAARIVMDYEGRHVHAVVPGADRLPRRPRALEGGGAGVVWLGVGSLIPRKRWPLLLDAMERLAEPGATLRLAGDATRDAEHALQIDAQIVRSPYLCARVARLGVVDEDALAEELARADALVLPSSLEGYGMVLSEAIHAGLPVIAARAGAIPEVVQDGEEAILFDDAGGLQGALRRFAADPSLRARMRRSAEARAGTLPTWDAAADAFRAILTGAIR